MKFLSVCSGIEAASVAWRPLGWKAVAFSEIEPFPCAVLAHHYPEVPNWGDMTKFQEWPDAAIDLLCGGTPCQSFSVAGLRKGLDDPRGNLMLTFGAIASRYRPRWLVWENVPGVLSSNGGRDFGSFLGLLGVLGYGFAYRVLDAQFAGVPQRRRRVFVVGCFGDWRSAAAVLLERHSLSGHPAPSRQARERVAPTLSARTKGGGGLGTDFDCDGGLVHAIQAGAMRENPASGPDGVGVQADIAYTLEARAEVQAIAGTLDANYGRLQGCSGQDANHGHSHLIPIDMRQASRGATMTNNRAEGSSGGAPGTGIGEDGDPAPTISTSHTPAICFDTTQMTSKANRSNPKHGDPCHPLAAGAHAPAIAFGWQNSASQGASASHTPTLDKSKVPAVGQAMQVRRLTPRECERLQGFHDDYTLIPLRNKKPSDVLRFSSDGPRYKALGNSWAVPCARWIGERIEAVAAIQQLQAAA